MSNNNYLIFHKDHPLSVRGVNAGAEMATLRLAEFLVKAGNKVWVCAQVDDGTTDHKGVRYINLGDSYDVSSALRQARELGSYHLISCGRALPVLQSEAEEICLSRVLISQDRSSNDTGINAKVLGTVADQIICVSNAQKEFFVSDGAPAEKISVLRNGADLEVFCAADPATRNYKRLVFAGALVQDKGIHLLVESFARLKQKYSDLTLDVYGSSEMWGREKLFDEKEIERSLSGLTFHGAVSQDVVAKAYQEAGIAVVPSIWFDPFPLTAMEAQVTGCPVVTFNVGGLGEGVVHGETGSVLQSISQEVLTTELDRLISSPDELQKMSARSLELQRPRYTWENFAEGLSKICQEIQVGEAPVEILNTSETQKPFGFMTTWNQECGLATYARYLLTQMPEQSYIVLAEDVRGQYTRTDEEYVQRCWNRGGQDWSAVKEVVKKNDLGLLHINAQPVFFEHPSFSQCMRELRENGVKIVLHFHNIFTLDPRVQALVAVADRVIVHTPENRLEAIANGAHPEMVQVLPHGIDVQASISKTEREALRKKLGMPQDEKIVVSFGFVQQHKGTDTLLKAVAELNAGGVACRGYVAGKPNESDPYAREYMTSLRSLAQELQVGDRVTFLDRFLSQEEVTEYLRAADVVLMDYRSQYFESSGAGALAIGAGAVVASSIAPPFMAFGDAVWHITQGFPASLSIGALLTNPTLFDEVKRQARAYAEEHSWSVTARRLLDIYSELQFQPAIRERSLPHEVEKENVVESKTPQTPAQVSSAPIRVLMQNRHNTFTQKGGDTIVLEKTIAGLQSRGVDVTVDLQGKEDPANFDIVHLINFALPEYTRILAERAQVAGTPFVVTTLYEDVPMFHNQSILMANLLIEYVRKGQETGWWLSNQCDLSMVDPCEKFANEWSAAHASMLLTNGSRESDTIRRDYGDSVNIAEVPLGYEVGCHGDPELFQQEYGVKDFILCVGRFESRKNQLMLLKALEDSVMPVVLAGGGFTYQPDYDQAVRGFKRRGETIVLERVSSEMLASAYAAAKVHALPSWYELPGLVSLEAAYYGCNVVVTDNGTSRDYFGDDAFYCEPGDEGSVRQAVMEAYASDVPEDLKKRVMSHTWDSVGERTLTIYRQVLGLQEESVSQNVVSVEAPTMQPQFQLDQSVHKELLEVANSEDDTMSDYERFLTKGEAAAQEKNYVMAHELLSQAARVNPQSVRALKARGAVYLAEKQMPQAREFFNQAHAMDPTDARTLSGLGMCSMVENDASTAYPYFVEALKHDASQMIAILQLIEASYMINRYDDLERVLREYLKIDSEDDNMKFCLAGCLYKQARHAEAAEICRDVLKVNPNHIGSNELLEKIGPVLPVDVPTQQVQPEVMQSPAVEQPQAEAMGWQKLAQQAIQSIESTRLQEEPAAPQQVQTIAEQVEVVEVAPGPMVAAHEQKLQERVSTDIESSGYNAMDKKLARAQEAKAQRNLQECIELCNSALEEAPLGSDDARKGTILKAEALVLQGDIEEASELLESVLLAWPGNPRALCGQGAILASQSDWNAAVEKFNVALATDPRCDVAIAGLGLYAAQSGDFDTAWQHYQNALSINAENSRALLGIIEIGYSKQRYAEVESAIKRYLDMHPVDLNFIYSLAGCYYAQGKLQEAMKEIQKITLFEPDHEQAVELRGMIDEKISSRLGA